MVFLISAGQVQSETRLDFKAAPTLISGSELVEGSVYRFNRVAANTDAVLQVTSLHSATLLQIDDLENAPGLQPVLRGDDVGAYAEFRLVFVNSATNAPVSVTTSLSIADQDAGPLTHTFDRVSDFTLAYPASVKSKVIFPQVLAITDTGDWSENTGAIIENSGGDPIASLNFYAVDGINYRVSLPPGDIVDTKLLFNSAGIETGQFININDNPIARADRYNVDQNHNLHISAERGVLKNDGDIDSLVDDDQLSVQTYSVGSAVYAAGATAPTISGDLTLDSTGALTFLPASNYTGLIPLVEYELIDGKGGRAVGELSLAVNGVNTPPLAIDDSVVASPAQPLLIDVLANDSDIDGDLAPESLQIIADIEAFPPGTRLAEDGRELSVAGEGRWSISDDNQLFFLPYVNQLDKSGPSAITTIDYQIQDARGARSIASVVFQDDSSDGSVFGVTIDEDSNDDGFISQAELGGLIDVTVRLPDQIEVGESIRVTDGESVVLIPVDEALKTAGVAEAAFAVPIDGQLIEVSVVYLDGEGGELAGENDSAVLDITANDAPVVTIVADADNSGFVSATETQTNITVRIDLPASVSIDDVVSVNNGVTTTQIVVGPLDFAERSVVATIPNVTEGETLTVQVQITDAAGNRSPVATDSALLDTVAPGKPYVTTLVTNSATPVIDGGYPIEETALLTVSINGAVYASGDGQLIKGGDGTWQLTIPPSDALLTGTYDVRTELTDMAGNTSRDDTSDELTVDLIIPELLVQNPGPSTDPAPMVSGTTDQADGALVVVSLADGSFVCEAVVINLAWSCRTQVQLETGTTNLTVTTEDAAGNLAEAAAEVRVVEATDTDGDGAPDDLEGTGDFDADGVANYLDLDSDNDSIPDAVEGVIDSDEDGKRNYLDIDSDNDGIADLIEAAGGDFSEFESAGMFDGVISVGANGLADILESGAESGNAPTPRDTDGDGVADYLDHDSDNDSIADSIENAYVSVSGDYLRQDGLTVAALDTDADGVPNYRDIDSDQDGIADLIETRLRDTDGDRRVDAFSDLDLNGITDAATGLAPDLDEDGVANFIDADSDGDGISDLIEAGGVDQNRDGIHDSEADANGNGVPDSIDSTVTLGADLDGDSIDDLYDSDYISAGDSDEDGIINAYDSDANGDGMIDRLFDDNAVLSDTNGNGIVDVYEVDEPQIAALIQTGLGGNGAGCSIAGLSDGSHRPIDPVLAGLLLVALFGVFSNRGYATPIGDK